MEIHDLVESIPEDVEEQEKMLTKIYETAGYTVTPTHYTPRWSMVQMAGSGLFQSKPCDPRLEKRAEAVAPTVADTHHTSEGPTEVATQESEQRVQRRKTR